MCGVNGLWSRRISKEIYDGIIGQGSIQQVESWEKSYWDNQTITS